MGRAWRIEYENALYHVLSRGNELRDIYYDNSDRNRFLETIGEMSERFATDIFAYALMDNHYHLLLRTQRANLSKAMQWFGTTYTRRFNNRHKRSGHLFQGRFKSIIIENEEYLIQLSCYIHRNPLRAGIVKRLVDYPWSSYPFYAYGKAGPTWLSTKLILSRYRNTDAHRFYREKVQRYSNEEKRLWEDFRHSTFLGSKEFVDHLRNKFLPEKLGREIAAHRQSAKELDIVAIMNTAARLIGRDVQEFGQPWRVSGQQKVQRDLIIYFIWQTGAFTNQKIGKMFGLTYSAVSHIVRKIRSKLEKDPEFRIRYIDINSQFKV